MQAHLSRSNGYLGHGVSWSIYEGCSEPVRVRKAASMAEISRKEAIDAASASAASSGEAGSVVGILEGVSGQRIDLRVNGLAIDCMAASKAWTASGGMPRS